MTLNGNTMQKLLMLLAVLLCMSCVQRDEMSDLAEGRLELSIGQISLSTETRATPSVLGKPLVDEFALQIQRSGTAVTEYKGKFKESIGVPAAAYDITATCGEDVIIGRDAPFYIGTAQAQVEVGQTKSVNISCHVGNALVSVMFGRDDAERQAFDEMYDDYGLLVKIGQHSMAITKETAATSIYFQAGSSPELIFYGTLKDGRVVSTVVSHQSIPKVFQAGNHAIVRLSLSGSDWIIIEGGESFGGEFQ